MSEAAKPLDVTSIEDARKKMPTMKFTGNGNLFQLLSKASCQEQGWMKSSKAMEIEGVGCVVQVTTQHGGQVAEALCFVPGVRIVDDANDGRKLVSSR